MRIFAAIKTYLAKRRYDKFMRQNYPHVVANRKQHW